MATAGRLAHTHPSLRLKEIPRPTPGPKDVVVRISAVALNHRDLFLRQHLYPAIAFDDPLLADGYGVVVDAGPDVPGRDGLLHRPVLLTPSRGWAADPDGPEDAARFAAVGGTTLCEGAGTAQEFVVVPHDEVELAPPHLTPAEGAALPLAGLTAWRALVTKAGIGPGRAAGRNVLVTGVGGGVALAALQFGVALGANVFVTSGDLGKLERARELGAAGGVSYKDADWDRQLATMLPDSRPFLDAVVDGAGGDVVKRAVRILKPGGIVSCYGMTVGPKMDWLMQAVLKNIELRGSTLGSRKEFAEMVDFVRKNKVRPVVSRVVKGLDNLEAIDGLFEEMNQGRQFGKLVIEIASQPDESPSKL